MQYDWSLVQERPSDINILAVRAALGIKYWLAPEPKPSYDRSGLPGVMWHLNRRDKTARVIISVDFWEDGAEWIHASMSCRNPNRVPTYYELKLLHQAVFKDGWAYHVFAPSDKHVNLHENVLHLWGRADGKRVLPDFSFNGTV